MTSKWESPAKTNAIVTATELRPGYAIFPPREGEWRAKKRKPMVSVILSDHGGRLSARHYVLK